ncbi:MAG: GNAT family N-acetyltransferase [Bacteroidota bacterium]
MSVREMFISTNKALLDFNKIHSAIKNAYWGSYRTETQTQKTIDNSICYGLYKDSEQLGFARVLTDEVAFAYIMDVIIFEDYQGQGLGKRLIEYLLDDPRIKDVLTICLKTKDAHTFYAKYGFTTVGNSDLWMAIDRAKLN